MSVFCFKHNNSPTMFLIDHLYKAFVSARLRKRHDSASIEFETDLEFNLLELENELIARRYEISPCSAFVISKPVKREIIAPCFRDRVVQHFIHRQIYPICDRKFIHDAYSCRLNKGTHFGVNRLYSFFQSCSDNYSKSAFVLKMDISGFYMSIKKEKLLEFAFGMLENETHEYKEIVEWLLEKLIMHDYVKNIARVNPISAWDDFPKNKSLFYSAEGCGLPVGNLTSQLFGNIYLTKFDHWVKRELKCRYYGRYVDDMVIVHNSKAFLLEAKERIGDYLMKNLNLLLHPKKTYLQPIEHGCAYLGAFVLPHRIYAGRRISSAFKKSMFDSKRSKSQLDSYMGMLKHWNCHRLAKKWLASYVPVP